MNLKFKCCKGRLHSFNTKVCQPKRPQEGGKALDSSIRPT